jgi:hypothetical protein
MTDEEAKAPTISAAMREFAEKTREVAENMDAMIHRMRRLGLTGNEPGLAEDIAKGVAIMEELDQALKAVVDEGVRRIAAATGLNPDLAREMAERAGLH